MATFTELALVARGANIVVVTRSIVEQVDAAANWHAGIVGTHVVIVTVHCLGPRAHARLADIPRRTIVTVITGPIVR